MHTFKVSVHTRGVWSTDPKDLNMQMKELDSRTCKSFDAHI